MILFFRSFVSVSVVLALGIISMTCSLAQAQEQGLNPHKGYHDMVLHGPWELVVQKGAEGQALYFPIDVKNEEKAQVLDKTLPLMGTPIKLKLREYWPNIKKDYLVETQEGAGAIVDITIMGNSLNQRMFLLTDDPLRRTISSTIGRVEVVKLKDAGSFSEKLNLLANPKNIGVLTVQYSKAGEAASGQNDKIIDEYVVAAKQTVDIPQDNTKITILEYFPHFSRDNETKSEKNQSERPVNPAIKVKVQTNKGSYEKWLWSKFPSFEHEDHFDGMSVSKGGVMKMSFRHIPVRDEVKCYTLFVADGKKGLIATEDDTTKIEDLVLGQAYPFAGEYYFRVEHTHAQAVLTETYANDSDVLHAPALVLDYQDGKISEQKILELGKPTHIKSDNEMIILMMRRQTGDKEHKTDSGDTTKN